jgi:hypothetical protein
MTASHTLHDCYNAIIKAANSTASNNRLIQYAATYAEYGLTLPDALSKAELTPESRVQAIYTLGNLTSWRGEEASAVRNALKSITTR